MLERLRPQPVLLAAALLVATAVPASAQDVDDTAVDGTPSGEDARDDARSRRAELEQELGLLRRSDVELAAELDRLDAEIAALEQRVVDAEIELDALSGQLSVLHEDLVVAEQRAAEQKERLVERAVAAYVDPRPHLGMALLADADLEDIGRRRVLLDAVADRDQVVLDAHVAAESQARAVRDETQAAEARTGELKAGAEADLARLRESRTRQAAVSAALDDRIADFQAEADALAAEESRLTALLAARRAQVAAQPSTTTTTTPSSTSTSAPTTSTERSSSTTTTAAPSTSSTRAPGTTGPSPTTTATTQPPSSTATSASTTSTTAPTTTTTRGGGTTLAWPTNGVLTSTFGMRWGRMHRGIDIGAPEGTPIVVAAAGTVFFAGPYGDYGNLILVDHGDGMVTAYAHQSSFAVTSGGVSRGQTIGYVGNTGRSTGPHLHFEVRLGGTAVDPMGYLG